MFSVYDVFLCASKLTPFFFIQFWIFFYVFQSLFFCYSMGIYANSTFTTCSNGGVFFFYMHCDISKHVSYKLLHTSHFRETFCDIYSCKFPIPWYTTRIYFDIGLLVLFLLFESHSFLSNKYALV